VDVFQKSGLIIESNGSGTEMPAVNGQYIRLQKAAGRQYQGGKHIAG
jgi:hypothetical protein